MGTSNENLPLDTLPTGAVIYLLDLFCNGTNPTVRERSAELFSKMMSDKLIGPKVKIILSKFMPTIFTEAMKDSAEASVHIFEGKFYKLEQRILPLIKTEFIAKNVISTDGIKGFPKADTRELKNYQHLKRFWTSILNFII